MIPDCRNSRGMADRLTTARFSCHECTRPNRSTATIVDLDPQSLCLAIGAPLEGVLNLFSKFMCVDFGGCGDSEDEGAAHQPPSGTGGSGGRSTASASGGSSGQSSGGNGGAGAEPGETGGSSGSGGGAETGGAGGSGENTGGASGSGGTNETTGGAAGTEPMGGAGAGGDAGADAPATETVIATGTLKKTSDDEPATGNVSIVRLPSGALVFRTGSDFHTVPGPTCTST